MNSLPKFNEADKYIVTAVNPLTGAVAMETFRDGDYTCYGPTVLNDEIKMNDFIRDLVIRQLILCISCSFALLLFGELFPYKRNLKA